MVSPDFCNFFELGILAYLLSWEYVFCKCIELDQRRTAKVGHRPPFRFGWRSAQGAGKYGARRTK